MKKLRFLMPVWFAAVAAGFSAIVMLLWNWLMPAIFNLTTISFWQALGLLLLMRILFGKFHGRHGKMMGHMMHGHGMHGSAMREKWMKMTDEERKEFIQKRHQHMHHGKHCGHHKHHGHHGYHDHHVCFDEHFESETETEEKKENK